MADKQDDWEEASKFYGTEIPYDQGEVSEEVSEGGSNSSVVDGSDVKLPRISEGELTLILTTLRKRGLHTKLCECGAKHEAIDSFVDELMEKLWKSPEFQAMLPKWKMGLQMTTRTHIFSNILIVGIVLGTLLSKPEFMPFLPETPKTEEGEDIQSLFDKLSDELKH